MTKQNKVWNKKRAVTKNESILVIALIIVIIVAGYLALRKPPESDILPGEINLSDLVVTPTSVMEDESVTISAVVRNVGESEITSSINLEINGEVEESESFSLTGGEEKTLSFTVNKGVGEYDVEIGTLAATFTVKMSIRNPDALVVQDTFQPDTLDPAENYAGVTPIWNVYETLIHFDREHTDQFVPILATVVPTLENGLIQDDGLTYIFPIREGVEFSNGNPLTPEDVEYSIERMLVVDPAGGPGWLLFKPLLGNFGSRSGGEIVVTAEDIDNTIESNSTHVIIHLTQPFPPFLQVLSLTTGSIVDKEWSIEQDCWPGTWENWKDYNNPGISPLEVKMMGTGPYKFDHWTREVEFVYVANENYWRETPPLAKVIVKYITEWSTVKMMFLNGDLDIIDVPPPHRKELEDIEGITIHKGLSSMGVDVMMFNYAIDPNSKYIGSGMLDGEGIPTDFFTDKNVRLGFAYSFDYDTYLEDAYFGESTQPSTMVPFDCPFFNPDQESRYLDLEMATEYFKEAYDGELWEKGFKMTITYNVASVETRIGLDMLVANIIDINPKFEISLLPQTSSKFWAETWGMDPTPVAINPNAAWVADYADPDIFTEGFMHSEGGRNWNYYRGTPEIDELSSAGAKTSDPDERREIYYELQKIWYDEAMGIPISTYSGGRFYHRDWVTGFYWRPLWGGVLSYFEYDKGY